MRQTLQRKIILEELRRVRHHFSATEVYERVRRRIPQISFGTVYRNLKLLREKGQVLELTLGKEASLWDGVPDAHYHFTCDSCGQVSDLPAEYNRAWDSTMARKTGFLVTEHRAEFYGYCDKCRGKAGPLQVRDVRPQGRKGKAGHKA